MPASVLGGNYATFVNISAERASFGGGDIADLPPLNKTQYPYPGGSHTGIGWTYLRYGHAASTAWAGLLLMFQACPHMHGTCMAYAWHVHGTCMARAWHAHGHSMGIAWA